MEDTTKTTCATNNTEHYATLQDTTETLLNTLQPTLLDKKDCFKVETVESIVSACMKSNIPVESVANLYEVLYSLTPALKDNNINKNILRTIAEGHDEARNIALDLDGYIQDVEGEFTLGQVYSSLCANQKLHKDLIRQGIRRYVTKSILESVGSKSGVYRKVDKSLKPIDINRPKGSEYPITWPLGIHNLVKMFPKNIVILSGSSNAGKTSFLFETIRLNQAKHKITYFCSEGGEDEVIERLELFKEVWPTSKRNFECYERDYNFADVIRPDGFNIIDFMEVYDDDYVKVGRWIRDVYRKLETGVAVIALQKKRTTKKETHDFGRGGETTLEKPRLYLAMDFGRIKIVKSKWFRDKTVNPNNMVRQFKLVDGWKFLPQGEWLDQKEEIEQNKRKQYGNYGVKQMVDDVFVHEED